LSQDGMDLGTVCGMPEEQVDAIPVEDNLEENITFVEGVPNVAIGNNASEPSDGNELESNNPLVS
jgi:hypothetical protein